MDRYIDAEKAINSVDTSVINSQYAISIIKSAPTEDVAPVVHAHWIVEPYRGDLLRYACSNPKCKHYEFHVYKEYRGSNYCPDCGAKMDEVINDD